MLVCSVSSDSLQPYGLYPDRLLLFMGFSRQECWSGLPCSPPGDLPDPASNPCLLYWRWFLYCLATVKYLACWTISTFLNSSAHLAQSPQQVTVLFIRKTRKWSTLSKACLEYWKGQQTTTEECKNETIEIWYLVFVTKTFAKMENVTVQQHEVNFQEETGTQHKLSPSSPYH